MSFANDNFTGSTNTLLDAHTPDSGGSWTQHPSYAQKLAISSSNSCRLHNLDGQYTVYYHSANPATAEYDVEADLTPVDTQVWGGGLGGRINTAANTYYELLHYTGDNTWYLQKHVAGVTTTLGTAGQTLSLGVAYHMKLQIRDAAKKVFVDGVEIITSADNAITAAGQPGLVCYNSGGSGNDLNFFTLDTWVATDASSGTNGSATAVAATAAAAGGIPAASGVQSPAVTAVASTASATAPVPVVTATGLDTGVAVVAASSAAALAPVVTGTAPATVLATAATAVGAGVVPTTYSLGAPELLLDASTVAGNDGDTIQTWTDGSGNSRSATQATAGLRPTLRTGANGMNGVAVLEFGSNKRMVTTSFFDASYNTTCTVYWVARRTSGTSQQVVYEIGSGSNLYADLVGAVPPGNCYIRGGTRTTARVFHALTPDSPAEFSNGATVNADAIVCAWMYNGTALKIWGNGRGNVMGTPTAGSPGDKATGNLGLSGTMTLGTLADGTTGLSGQIAYLAVYKARHTDAQRNTELLRLRQRYGVVPRRMVYCLGDSNTAGTGDITDSTTQSWPAQMMPLLDGGPWDILNGGGGGATSDDVLTQCTDIVDPFRTTDQLQILIMAGGGNDASQAQTWTNFQAICGDRRTAGFRTVAAALWPRSLNNFGTANALIRAGWPTVANALVDVTVDAAFDSVPSAASDCANLTYYQADGTHISVVGMGLIAQYMANRINAAILGGGGSANLLLLRLLGRH